MTESCQSEWEFDVDFAAACEKAADHVDEHRAVVTGNGGIDAVITWRTS